jgi:hypothetical protein
MESNLPLYGLMAEFETSEALLEAARQAHKAGYRAMDAYSPFPVEGLADALDARSGPISRITFAGGVLGAILGYGTQWYSSVISYPMNAGGKPPDSWPTFIPITFEMTILGAATAAILALIWFTGLPEPYHPVFNVPGFQRASQDRFFLAIEIQDRKFDQNETRSFLQNLGALAVAEVKE